ncbi:MAG: hypothetical protein OXC26_18350 [Albidovulum sp.]|nr:hypothetical protein [Albidovulum sp.]
MNAKATMEHVLESGNEVTAERCRLEWFVLALLEMTVPDRDAPDGFRNRGISYEFLI